MALELSLRWHNFTCFSVSHTTYFGSASAFGDPPDSFRLVSEGRAQIWAGSS